MKPLERIKAQAEIVVTHLSRGSHGMRREWYYEDLKEIVFKEFSEDERLVREVVNLLKTKGVPVVKTSYGEREIKRVLTTIKKLTINDLIRVYREIGLLLERRLRERGRMSDEQLLRSIEHQLEEEA